MSRLKVVLVGASGVGKSNLAHRFTANAFVPHMPSDIAGQYHSKTLERSDTSITLELWTTPGKNPNIGSFYYKEAQVIGLTFDLTNPNTLNQLSYDYNFDLIKKSAPNAQFILLGTKGDLTKNITVSPEDITTFQTIHNIQHYVKTSAKTGDGIADFQTIILEHTPAPKCVTPAKKTRTGSSLFSRTPTSAVSQSSPPTNTASPREEPSTSQLNTTVTTAFPASTAPNYRSLLAHKDNFIRELSQYKLDREKRGANVFGYSKQEKINAATKAMACFYGADKITFSERDKAALKTGELLQSILRALQRSHDIQLINSLQTTSQAVTNHAESYKEALIQFLSDYKAMRELHGKGSFFGLSGFNKNTKISAVEKLILRLKGESSDNFSHAEIGALEEAGSKLKKMIETTLGWFSHAPAFENFMRTYTTSTSVIPNSTPSQLSS